MQTFAVVQITGKQYIVKEGDQILVENVGKNANESFDVPVLMTFDSEAKNVILGAPELKNKATVEVVENLKGTKIRVSKFKAKVRFRKVTGFRPHLSKVKIVKLS